MLLAEKVQSNEEFEFASKWGFEYFPGILPFQTQTRHHCKITSFIGFGFASAGQDS